MCGTFPSFFFSRDLVKQNGDADESAKKKGVTDWKKKNK